MAQSAHTAGGAAAATPLLLGSTRSCGATALPSPHLPPPSSPPPGRLVALHNVAAANVSALTPFFYGGAPGYYLGSAYGGYYATLYTKGTTNAVLQGSGSSAGSYDARCVGIFNGQLYGSDSAEDTGANGIFTIGTGIAELGSSLQSMTLLPGFSAMASASTDLWTFVFENATSLWAADGANWAGAAGFSVRNYAFANFAWAQASVALLDAANPVYSIAGRVEGGVFVLYGASRAALFRFVPSSGAAPAVLATPTPGTLFRGVAVAPVAASAFVPRTPLPTATPSGTGTATGTPTSTGSGTRTSSPSNTASPSSTLSPGGSASNTPSAAATPSTTPSPSGTPTPSPSETPSGSLTPTPSRTPSRTPAIAAYQPTSVLVVRLGDAGSNARTAAAGVAQPVYIDEYDSLQGLGLISSAAFANGSCSLASGKSNGALYVEGLPQYYWWDTEGFPTLTADGTAVTLPCYQAPPGSVIHDTDQIRKALSIVWADGKLDTTTTTSLPTGGAPIEAGVYLQLVALHNVAAAYPGAGMYFGGAPGWAGHVAYGGYWMRQYQGSGDSGILLPNPAVGAPQTAGANDARCVGIFNGQLYGTDSHQDAANNGLFAIGSGLPTGQTTATNLPGFAASASAALDLWTFAFENASSVWIADGANYYTAPSSAAFNVRHYTANAAGTWAQAGVVLLDVAQATYSIAGRQEGGGFVLYAATIAKVYRYVPASGTVTLIATAAAGTLFRGVAPAPVLTVGLLPPTPLPTATPTPSLTPTGSASVSFGATPSNSGTPSSTASTSQTATATSSASASSSGTATTTPVMFVMAAWGFDGGSAAADNTTILAAAALPARIDGSTAVYSSATGSQGTPYSLKLYNFGANLSPAAANSSYGASFCMSGGTRMQPRALIFDVYHAKYSPAMTTIQYTMGVNNKTWMPLPWAAAGSESTTFGPTYTLSTPSSGCGSSCWTTQSVDITSLPDSAVASGFCLTVHAAYTAAYLGYTTSDGSTTSTYSSTSSSTGVWDIDSVTIWGVRGATQTATPSATPSQTGTPASSTTPSITAAPSVSLSPGATPSVSPSVPASASSTPTPSASQSATAAATASATVTASRTAAPTASPVLCQPPGATSAPTPGNLIALRIGTGLSSPYGVAAGTFNAFLDEVSTATGAVVQSWVLPAGSAGGCVVQGGANVAYNQISRTGDGSAVLVACYSTDVNPTLLMSSTTNSAIPKAVHMLDGFGETALLSTWAPGGTGQIRNVAALNTTGKIWWTGGSGFYAASAGSGTGAPEVNVYKPSTSGAFSALAMFGGAAYMVSSLVPGVVAYAAAPASVNFATAPVTVSASLQYTSIFMQNAGVMWAGDATGALYKLMGTIAGGFALAPGFPLATGAGRVVGLVGYTDAATGAYTVAFTSALTAGGNSIVLYNTATNATRVLASGCGGTEWHSLALAPVPLPTPSGTVTPSQTRTPSPTASPTGTPSTSSSVSNTASPSTSATLTAAATASSTRTATKSAKPTSSATAAATGTPTPATTGTPTPTGSVAPTPSTTASTSGSSSPSPSGSASQSAARTPSGTAAATSSRTASRSAAVTRSGTAAATTSAAPSASAAASVSAAATLSAASTPAATPSAAPLSQSATPAATPSRAGTPPPTPSRSHTAAVTSTKTPSAAATLSKTATASKTATKSGTASKTATKSGTATRTPSKKAKLL